MITPDKIYLRDYTKIFTGSNQEYGYDTPFFGFTTDTVEINLKADKSTFFHYPRTAAQIKLSDTDLIESGAFGASIPYKADKIFKKLADYQNDTPWGNALPVNLQKGVWLCAWLSANDANPSEAPIWMDRWYEPGYLNNSLALFTSSNSAVYDVPSQLIFDPGCYFRYDHIGSKTNEIIVNRIKNLKIHLDDWGQITPDKSNNGNDAQLFYYSSDMIGMGVNEKERPKDNALKLQGKRQYGSVLYSKTFDVSGTITCNAWIKSDNWVKPQTQHFISNGLRGGWSLGVNNGFFTPFSVITDLSGNTIFTNQNAKIYKDIKIPGLSKPVKHMMDPEHYLWLLDNGTFEGNKHLYKIDYNGNIDTSIDFLSTINLKDFVIDKYNNAWVLSDTGYISSFNPFGKLQTTIPDPIVSPTRLTINKNNVISAFNAFNVCVMDDPKYYWTIDSNLNLYQNENLFLSGMSAINVQAPLGNDVYALYGGNKVMQITGYNDQLTNTMVFGVGLTAQIPDEVTWSSAFNRNLYFSNEHVNGEYIDYVWVVQPNSGYLYKYTKNLNLVKKTNVTYVKNSLLCCAVRGDSSGYNWHRLFNYPNLKEYNTPQIEAVAYVGTGIPTLTAQKVKTVIPVSQLSINDWHMFTFTVDIINQELRLYSDMILRDTTPFGSSGNSIFYKYETPIILGSNVGKIIPLDEELEKIDKLYWNGGIDDLRVYTGDLSNSDIRHLYLNKYDFKDLKWNMPTGLQSYIEEIVRFFKFKMPGQKSQFYNIRLVGLKIDDIETRTIIEDIIKDTVNKISPLYTSLYKIIWE